eukprot:5585189-Pleurochrysis_carterae.AAC.1
MPCTSLRCRIAEEHQPTMCSRLRCGLHGHTLRRTPYAGRDTGSSYSTTFSLKIEHTLAELFYETSWSVSSRERCLRGRDVVDR